MTNVTRVVQYGLGPIGSAMARHAAERSGLLLVGGVDIDPVKVGKDVGEIIGLDQQLGIPVAKKLAHVLEHTETDVVLHTTNSHFPQFKGQILEILEAELDIVSTAEELSFPWLANPDEASEIDGAAKRVGKTVLGTGVNPGFLMDTLPLNLTAMCQRVDRIEVRRVINASKRRGPFQAKIGCAMAVDDFNAKIAAGRMGHVGLRESISMVFHTLGKTLVHYESTIEPVVTDRPIQTGSLAVESGQVRGLKQVARGHTKEGEFMVLTFIAALESEEDQDTIKVTGKPNLEVTLKGTNGDIATVAIAVNAIRRVREAVPGLITMKDLPIVSIW